MAQICLFDQTVQNMNTSLVTSCFFVLHFSRSLNDLLTPLSTTEHETSKKFDISAVDNFFFWCLDPGMRKYKPCSKPITLC